MGLWTYLVDAFVGRLAISRWSTWTAGASTWFWCSASPILKPRARAWADPLKHGGSGDVAMRTHILMSICGGLILAAVATVIGLEGIALARPDARSSMEIVNRTRKGDRLPLVQITVLRASTYDSELPDGCDPLVSSLTHSHLAHVAARCEF